VTPRLPLVFLVLLAACRTPPLPPPDGGNAASCGDPLYADVPILTFTFADLNLCPLDLIRVGFEVSASLCQVLGPTEVAFDAASNTYTVRARATVDTQPCSAGRRTLTGNLALSDVARPSPGNVMVHDLNGTAMLTLPIQKPLADGKCGTVTFPAACSADSDCPSALRCSYDLNMCVHTCFSDADCGDDAPVCSHGVCSTGRSCDPEGCEAGARCIVTGSSIACRWSPRVTPGVACNSTGCGPGALCRCGACTLPCATDGDCAGGHCDPSLGCVIP
jgi:hypothetical protein